MLTKIFSASVEGINAKLITIEIDISIGLLQWHIVGLPDLAVKESKERIIAAIRNSGIKLPDRKITINLSPADMKKKGSLFDFAIIIGLLDAAGIIHIPQHIKENSIFIGEISLDGSLTDAKGTLSIVADIPKLQKKYIFLPPARAQEAKLIENSIVYAPKNIIECIKWFSSENEVYPECKIVNENNNITKSSISFDQVYGNESAKRALQIAVAGKHCVLLIGSPGSGKTFLAERIKSILPHMNHTEKIEVTKIYSTLNDDINKTLIYERPFIAPHHSISTSGLIGGGTIPRPGSISLAHKGILFLDELLEYKKSALEALRQPLESKYITITRSQAEYIYPADFILIAATNPCPCGYYGDKRHNCQCQERHIKQYMNKLSGPLLDRIDLHIGVYGSEVLQNNKIKTAIYSQEKIIEGIQIAIKNQQERYKQEDRRNGELASHEIDNYFIFEEGVKESLDKLYQNMRLSMRGYFKIIKIAQTIADIEDSKKIKLSHVLEAASYRIVDKYI